MGSDFLKTGIGLVTLFLTFVLLSAAVALALTAEKWLPRILGWLDRRLVELGFGTYSARFVTWLEKRLPGGKRHGPSDPE